jgi:RimJ/RimL family protein N-acetyltransferase
MTWSYRISRRHTSRSKLSFPRLDDGGGAGGCYFSWLPSGEPPLASKARSLRRGPRFQGKGFALNAVSPIFGREGAAFNRVIPLRVSPFHARGLAS